MGHTAYLGHYYYMGLMFHLKELDGKLVAELGGTPAGHEIELEPLGGEHYRMLAGPAMGLPFSFLRRESGEVYAIQAGNFLVDRVTPEQASTLPVTGRNPAPVVAYTPEKEQAFAALLDWALSGTGDWLDYRLPYPVHEFIQYVSARDVVIFHGSNDATIEQFVPMRSSTELYDRTGRGNRLAVYGTHEGLWSMFFAVVDRARLRGSIRNGVAYFFNRQGERVALYNFSINQEQLAERPFCEGALYFLPRSDFERLEMLPGIPANEWACDHPIQPLAKLRVAPQDWPFLDLLEGHDDSLLIRMGQIGKAIREAVLRAENTGERFTIWFPAEVLPAADLEYYLEKQAILIPAAKIEYAVEAGQGKLVFSNLPPAYLSQYQKDYAALLKMEHG